MAEGEVGKEIFLEAEWENYGPDAPTSATARIWIVTGGSRSYLQDDLASLGPAADALPTISLGSGAFRRTFTPIAAMAGFLVEWEIVAEGPLAFYPKQGGELKVTTSDEDDLLAQLAVTQATVASLSGDLADARAVLDAVEASLDTVIARLGLTGDVGGSSTAGTVMAKLNMVLLSVRTGDVEISGTRPVS